MECYSIDRSRVVYEVLKSEVIVIDFNTGNYYALTHIAKQIWQFIERRTPLDQIAQVLSDHLKSNRDKVREDVQRFIEELLEEGLIEVATEIGDDRGVVDPVEMMDGWEYDAPRLQKYTDVQDLLLIDPIHEVTEVGWPDKLD